METHLKFTLQEKDFPADLRDKYSFVDLLALSCGYWTQEEMEAQNWDYITDSIGMWTQSYDFEDDFLKLCNEYGAEYFRSEESIEKLLTVEMLQKAIESDLQFGAFLALEYPETWKALVEEWKKLNTEVFHYSESPSCKYREEMEKQEQELNDEIYSLWLYGDRNNDGLLAVFKEKFNLNTVNYDKDKNEVSLILDGDFCFDLFGLDDKEVESMPNSEIKDQFASLLIGNIKETIKKEEKEIQERKVERERVEKSQKQMKEKQEQKRKEKLLAMKK